MEQIIKQQNATQLSPLTISAIRLLHLFNKIFGSNPQLKIEMVTN